MRGRRGRRGGHGLAGRPDAHVRVQDILNEGRQKLQRFFGQADGVPGERTREPRVEFMGPPDQASIQDEDGGRPEGRDTGLFRKRSSDDGDERGPRRDSLPKENGRQRNVEGDTSGDTRRAGRDSGPLRDLRETVRDLGRSRESHGDNHASRTRGGEHDGRRTHGGDHEGRRARGGGSDDGPIENLFRTQFQNSGRDRNVLDNSPARGLLNTLGLSDDGPQGGRRGVDVASFVSYLRGETGGAHLPAELRQVLDGASRVLGSDFVATLEARASSTSDGDRVVRFVEHALERVAHTLERAVGRGGGTTEGGGGATSGVPARAVKEAVGELLAADAARQVFRQAEKTGAVWSPRPRWRSRVCSTARRVAATASSGAAAKKAGGCCAGRVRVVAAKRRPELQPAPHPLEFYATSHAGAFRPPEVNTTVSLRGALSSATEMMRMMRR